MSKIIFVVGGDGFCGGIHDLTYKVGPSKDTLKMVVENTNKQEKIPNVVGVIPGTLSPENDMPVLLGNHRDAWYVAILELLLFFVFCMFVILTKSYYYRN